MISLFFLLTAFFGVSRDEVERTTSIIDDYLSTSYAPHEWKTSIHGVEFSTLLKGLENAETVKEYQRELKKRLGTLRDHHVNLYTYRTESASLPFTLCMIDGEFLVKKVESYQIAFDIRPGDRVISLDGTLIETLVEEKLPVNPTETEIALASEEITWKTLEEAPANSHLILERDGKRISYQLAWDRFPELIPDREIYKERVDSILDITRLQDLHLCNKKAAYASKRGVLPPLGEIVWESDEDSPFYGYLYKLDGRIHGFLRLHSYHMRGREKFYKEIRELFQKFQEEAETLVIDQTENEGGYLFFGYCLLSMLTDKPLSTPKEYMKITDSDLYFAITTLEELEQLSEETHLFSGKMLNGYYLGPNFDRSYKQFLNFVIDESYGGKSLIGPIPLYGIEQIDPHPNVRFTGPLLMLIDASCFSAADYIPAILQDNKRALLIGTKTAGAGGFVRRFRFPNHLGLQEISLTGSNTIRENGEPIEDLGVTPDLSLPVTKEDLKGGFERYAEVLRTVVRDEAANGQSSCKKTSLIHRLLHYVFPFISLNCSCWYQQR